MRVYRVLCVATAIILAASCSKEDEKQEEQIIPKVEIPTESQAVFSQGMSFDPGTSSQSQTVKFNTTADWSAEVSDAAKSPAWVSIQPTHGSAGSVTMTVTTDINPETMAREACVSIKCGSDTKTFSVKQAGVSYIDVESISFDKQDLTLPKGEEAFITATIKPDNATDTVISWSSSNDAVATVDNGRVTAINCGKAVITATIEGKMTTCDIIVPFPVPETVDLGMTVYWASFNLGASKPEDFGNYYAWGETDVKNDYSWETYKWVNGPALGDDDHQRLINNNLTKYNNDSSRGVVDNIYILEPEDDAANVWLGDGWRIPTYEEWNELMELRWGEKGTLREAAQNGVNGTLVTSSNGNSIFLPDVGGWGGTNFSNDIDGYTYGSYWSSSVVSSAPYQSWTCGFMWILMSMGVNGGSRFGGIAVRAVKSVPIISFELNKKSLNLLKGYTERLVATVKMQNNAPFKVTWESSSSDVASVDEDGKVTAISEGTTTIIATARDQKVSCEVSVIKQPVPEAIDLGLSVKWASFNIGASSPEEYGGYYAWGEAEVKEKYDWPTYKWRDNDAIQFTKYNNKSNYGIIDDRTVLEPEDDVAHVLLGSDWRMPTNEEFEELETHCTWAWTSRNGVIGGIITGPSGNSIFLPAAGCMNQDGPNYNQLEPFNKDVYGIYWSSSLFVETPQFSWYYAVGADKVSRNWSGRELGLSIRPVKEY